MIDYSDPVQVCAVVADLAARAGCTAVTVDDRIGAVQIGCGTQQQVVDLWNALADFWAEDPQIATLAYELRAGTTDDAAFATNVVRYVQDNIKWIVEPGERFAAPRMTLKAGCGDCDCSALLVASISKAGGVPARLAGMTRPTDPKMVHGVAQVQLPAGWTFAEASVKVPLGTDPQAILDGHGAPSMAGMGGAAVKSFPPSITAGHTYRGAMSKPFYVTQGAIKSGLEDKGLSDVIVYDASTVPRAVFGTLFTNYASTSDGGTVDSGTSANVWVEAKYNGPPVVIPLTISPGGPQGDVPDLLRSAVVDVLAIRDDGTGAQAQPPGPTPPPAPPSSGMSTGQKVALGILGVAILAGVGVVIYSQTEDGKKVLAA